MKRFLLIAGTFFFTLLTISLVGGWMISKTYIESDEFKEQVGRGLTRGAHGFVSNSVVDVASLKVTGLASIESGDINLRSADNSKQIVTATSAIVTLKLLNLFSLGPVHFDVDLAMQPRGRIKLTGRIPISLLFRSKNGESTNGSVLGVIGEISDLNAVELFDLMQAAQGTPYFRLTEGTVNGKFSYDKSIGRSEVPGQKSGQLSLTLTAAKWSIPSENKIVPIETLPIDLNLKDFVISLEKPIVLKDDSGTATLSGTINLPKFADQEKSWDIKASVNGSSGLLLVVSKLFKCPSPPAAYSFSITGEFSNSRCLGM